MGFSTSANVKFDGSDNIDIKDEVAGFDFGILFGAGAQYPIDPVTAFIDLRYTLGLSNLNDVEGESTVKNRGFMIAVGATVPLNE